MKEIIVLLLFPLFLSGQPNCNVFLWNKDTLQYRACEFAQLHKHDYYQFDWRQIKIWEETISICPYFAYPYREISSPYVKSGNFIEWKKNIDKAVEYAPNDYLHVRASLRYKFFADYEGALADIALLKKLINGSDIGSSSNGTYHLNVVKGLCLKALNRNQEAIDVIKTQLTQENHVTGIYDYLHLGVLQLEEGLINEAISSFLIQIKEYDIADNRYYLALAYKRLNNKEAFEKNIYEAVRLFEKGTKMFDGYNELFDQIYLIQIKKEIEKIKAKAY